MHHQPVTVQVVDKPPFRYECVVDVHGVNRGALLLVHQTNGWRLTP
ncbi:Uncharacterised protein [Vibrio cholerae]|nr:Uncharacterised protein [Vibrio cholerae]